MLGQSVQVLVARLSVGPGCQGRLGFSVPIPKNPGKEVLLLQPGVDDVFL